MNDTIHINLGAYQTDSHYVGTYTVRIWSHLLASINWIFKNPIPGNYLVQHGISMTIINNIAIVVEGFVADICWNYVNHRDHLKCLIDGTLDRMTWQKKKELYNNLFAKGIESYYGFEGISALI